MFAHCSQSYLFLLSLAHITLTAVDGTLWWPGKNEVPGKLFLAPPFIPPWHISHLVRQIYVFFFHHPFLHWMGGRNLRSDFNGIPCIR